MIKGVLEMEIKFSILADELYVKVEDAGGY